MKSPSRLLLLAALSLGATFTLPALAADQTAETPSVSTDAAVQKDLAALDRALNTNAKLEEALRTNLDKLSEKSFRVQNPEVDDLLKKQPGLEKALKVDQHFLLRRAILRLARVKATRPDALALDKFLDDHPDIRKPLQRSPSQIVDAKFLIAHPPLARFLESHPALSSVLLQQQDKMGAKEKKKQ
jgi:exonuclease VII large subunit